MGDIGGWEAPDGTTAIIDTVGSTGQVVGTSSSVADITLLCNGVPLYVWTYLAQYEQTISSYEVELQIPVQSGLTLTWRVDNSGDTTEFTGSLLVSGRLYPGLAYIGSFS